MPCKYMLPKSEPIPKMLAVSHDDIYIMCFGQVTVAPFTLPFASAVATACAATGTESTHTHEIWVLIKESRELIKGCGAIHYLHAWPKIHVAGWQGVSLNWQSPCMWQLPCQWLPHKPVRNRRKHSTMPKAQQLWNQETATKQGLQDSQV